MNDLLIRQLIDVATASDLAVITVKDEDGKSVIVAIGEQEWLDELFSEFY